MRSSVAIGISVGAVAVHALVCRRYVTNRNPWYDCVKPDIAPERETYAMVWLVLYALFGFCLWRALDQRDWRLVAMIAAHLALQVAWCRSYFESNDAPTSMAIMAAIVGLGLWMFQYSVDFLVRMMVIPITAWFGFAALMNAMSLPRVKTCNLR